MSLSTVLASLDAALKPKKQPAAKKLNLNVNPELESLWKWGRAADVLSHPGLATVAEERDEWWWSQVWLSPAQASSAQKELLAVPGFPRTLVPFATDEAGNYTCHDVKSGKLVDWDHETRKTRKLPGSLTTIFTTALELLKREARTPDAPPRSPAPSTDAKPGSIRAVKSKVLRKLSAHHKGHGFTGAAISGDGKLVAASVYGTHDACFGEVLAETELVPSEPGFAAQKKSMGFVQMNTSGFVFEGDRLVWRTSEQLSVWSWRGGKLTLDRGGQWKKGDFMRSAPLRLRAGTLAAAATVDDQVVIALWNVDAWPGVRSLEATSGPLKPKALVTVCPWTGADVQFDLDANGNVFTLESAGYQVCSLSRWDAKSGKRVAKKQLEDLDAVDLAVSPDGARVLVLAREGELLVFDQDLTLEHRVKTFKPGKKWGCGVRFAPSGAFFVTSAQLLSGGAGELSAWDTVSLKLLATLPVKEATQGFRVSSVCQSAVVTTSPLALFELRA